MLDTTPGSPFECKERKPVHPKWNQSWIVIGRTDAEAEGPILWPPDMKNWLMGKDLDAGKDWRQEEKGTTEDEMVGWHHWLNGHEFEQPPGVGDGLGSLEGCSLWDRKELYVTEKLNWTFMNIKNRRQDFFLLNLYLILIYDINVFIILKSSLLLALKLSLVFMLLVNIAIC